MATGLITRTSDETAVRDLFQNLLDDWERGDGLAYGSRFTEDADYVAFDGSYTQGRATIAASHQELFDRWLKDTRLVARIERIQFLAPDVALVHASGGTIFSGEARPRRSRDSFQTLVAVRRGGEWSFAAFHNTRIQRRSQFQWMLYGIYEKIFRR